MRAASGRTEITPPTELEEQLAAPLDAIEEVVRRQEHQISAEVAETLHHVVGVRGDVLLVAGEDDQSYSA